MPRTPTSSSSSIAGMMLLLLLAATTCCHHHYYNALAYTTPSSSTTLRSYNYHHRPQTSRIVLSSSLNKNNDDDIDNDALCNNLRLDNENNNILRGIYYSSGGGGSQEDDDLTAATNNNVHAQQPSRRDAIESLISVAAAVATTAVGSPTTAFAATTPTSSNELISSAAAASSTVGGLPIPPQTRSTTWPLGKVAFSLLPLAGSYTRRATVMEEVVKDTIWTMDQIQGVVNVNVPVRMTVVKLSPEAGGGLFIHNPLAPTPQLIQQIRVLERQYGPVRHIVLGTVALEHKATFGPFSQYFTKSATLWIQPGQWSFPIQVPIEFLGVVQSGNQVRILPSSQYIHGEKTLEDEIKSVVPKRYAATTAAATKRSGGSSGSSSVGSSLIPEWTVDIDYEMLEPLKFKSVGAYSETAFYHKSTQTLIVTDCVCSVTQDPPKVIAEDPRALLFHARDSIHDVVIDDIETRRKGWRRMVQFGLVFFPSQIDVVPFGQAISESITKIDPSMKSLGVGAVPGGSLYPWTWHDNDADLVNFNAISQQGKLFCPPILTKLILDREPARTLEWVDRITTRFNKFTHVIPGHLNNYVKATPKEFSEAFDPLRSNPSALGGNANKKKGDRSGSVGKVYPQRALAEDLALLQEASDLLTQFGVVAQSQVCDLEPARTVGRFASIAPK